MNLWTLQSKINIINHQKINFPVKHTVLELHVEVWKIEKNVK